MTAKPWVRDDVSYTVGEEEFTIPAESIVVSEPSLESEPSIKDQAKMYEATFTADTPHGRFRWQADIQQSYGPATVGDVVVLQQPTAVTDSEQLQVRNGDEDDEDE